MENTFEYIEHLTPKQQLDILLELLQEIGGVITVRQNQFSQYWIPRIADELAKEKIKVEYIKEKIRKIAFDE